MLLENSSVLWMPAGADHFIMLYYVENGIFLGTTSYSKLIKFSMHMLLHRLRALSIYHSSSNLYNLSVVSL